MNRLIAIKVGQGDAFYLENMGVHIVVDGGKSKIKFPSLFFATTDHCRLDIMIYTHNDSDHVNGLIGYFEGGHKCSEVWLPGSWLSRLNDLRQRRKEFIKELAENINDLDDDFIIDSYGSLEKIGGVISQKQWQLNDRVNNPDKFIAEKNMELPEGVDDIHFQVRGSENTGQSYGESNEHAPMLHYKNQKSEIRNQIQIFFCKTLMMSLLIALSSLLMIALGEIIQSPWI